MTRTKTYKGIAFRFNPFHDVASFCVLILIWVTDGRIRLFGARAAECPDPEWTARTRSVTRRLRSATKILRQNPLFACWLHSAEERAGWYTFSSDGDMPRLRDTVPASLEMALLQLVAKHLFEDLSLSPREAVEAAQVDLVELHRAGLIELSTARQERHVEPTRFPVSQPRLPLSRVSWTAGNHDLPSHMLDT